ncbi:MAG: hypothetical protein QOJ65_2763 [Fimbriimonadaceae bacterium]|nr:hypothetical protein [Fimbriimonadaceae bacterium]
MQVKDSISTFCCTPNLRSKHPTSKLDGARDAGMLETDTPFRNTATVAPLNTTSHRTQSDPPCVVSIVPLFFASVMSFLATPTSYRAWPAVNRTTDGCPVAPNRALKDVLHGDEGAGLSSTVATAYSDVALNGSALTTTRAAGPSPEISIFPPPGLPVIVALGVTTGAEA